MPPAGVQKAPGVTSGNIVGEGVAETVEDGVGNDVVEALGDGVGL